ncbi:HAD-like domain-containing protein [Cladorrhinum samala]|uniref:HAD-like domain-containing protein n=1 Tax=Cladorrhinum samala TaxID=585594 RepID=A0AAV9HWK8_9PEZI|nr:HAD-like domain-containing protein [Cladorrhinum samala]
MGSLLDIRINKPRLALIDFEGTLFDTRAAVLHAMTRTLQHVGGFNPQSIIKETVWHYVYGTDDIGEAFSRLLNTTGEPATAPHVPQEVWVAAYNAIYAAEALPLIEPYPGAKQLLEALRRERIPVVIFGSNKQQATIRDVLKGCDGMAEELLTGGQLPLMIMADTPLRKVAVKPDPASYKDYGLDFFAEYPGLAGASHVLVVGDTEADILYAKEIGAEACWVKHGYGNEAECLALAPHMVVENFGELEKKISNRNC